MLPAMSLDQRGTVYTVLFAFPGYPFLVTGPSGGCLSTLVEGEVFDVDLVMWEVEIRAVLLVLEGCSAVFVLPFVLILDVVGGQPIGDCELLEALDEFKVQCT